MKIFIFIITVFAFSATTEISENNVNIDKVSLENLINLEESLNSIDINPKD